MSRDFICGEVLYRDNQGKMVVFSPIYWCYYRKANLDIGRSTCRAKTMRRDTGKGSQERPFPHSPQKDIL